METSEIDILNLAIKYCPEFAYTNKNWDELPMLAHKFKDIKNPQYPYFIQPKLNGVRCLTKFIRLINSDVNPGVKLCSRGGQYYKIPHLQSQLAELYLHLYESFNSRDILLDGEIYKYGVPLQEISGAARKEEVTLLYPSNGWLEYWIYDVIDTKGSILQKDRIKNLNNLIEIIADLNLNHIKIVGTNTAYDKNEVELYHNTFVTSGYEGAILRSQKGNYEFNQRSYNLLKVKQYQDAEFKIIGCGSDLNKSLGESFYFILQNDINSLTFKARPTGTEKQKIEWYNNEETWKNKKATLRYFERSKDGLPLQGSIQHKLSKVLIEHLRPQGE